MLVIEFFISISVFLGVNPKDYFEHLLEKFNGEEYKNNATPYLLLFLKLEEGKIRLKLGKIYHPKNNRYEKTNCFLFLFAFIFCDGL